jgi:alkylation response protein AidB-like acyl-CoA dehydrogenase
VLAFEQTSLTPAEEDLRTQIRDFLSAEGIGDQPTVVGMTGNHDPGFSRRLGAAGFVGMALPREYGGAGRSAVDRFVVVEELLAAGAPVAAHWVADRQTAPTLLKFGTEEQRERFLPAIARGECFFSIGMSEPDAGSDLAGVRTRAHRVDGGWSLSGTKVWTSFAHLNHYFVVLCRTEPLGEVRHAGISQLIVDLRAPGVTVNPVVTLDGGRDFNEVVLDNVFVPDDLVLGEVGDGWRQVTSELSLERSGPDRWMSTYQVFKGLLADRLDAVGAGGEAALGHLLARYQTIRNLSLSVARMIDDGAEPVAEAALVKSLGTALEQEVVQVARQLVDDALDPGAEGTFGQLLAMATLTAPAHSIRGGTSEILRTIAARELAR